MHDLNTINRLNAENFAEGITQQTKAGAWVVAKYTGLHLVSFTAYANRDEAVAAVHEPTDSPDVTLRLFSPPVPITTLGDYIRRVECDEKLPLGEDGPLLAVAAGASTTAADDQLRLASVDGEGNTPD